MKLPAFLTNQITIDGFSLPFSLWDFLIQLLAPSVVAVLAIYAVFALLRRMIRKSSWKDASIRTILRWLRIVARLGALVTVFGLTSRLLGAELARWAQVFFRILNQPFFVSGNTQISIVTIVFVIPVVYAASWLGRNVRKMTEHGLFRRLNLDPARQFSILSVIQYATLAVALIIGLSIIGINMSSLAVIFGVLGIGLGFGLQNTVANFFAGLIIIFARPIKEGDRVLVGDVEGDVQEIKLIHTVVNTLTNETIIIPNSEIMGNRVHNYSYDDPSILVCNKVQVAYESDLDKVREVMMALAKRSPYAMAGKEHSFHVWSFDDSGITVRVCVWIRHARDRLPAFGWTNHEIWRAFRENGITIPFPQVDLHIKDGGEKITPSRELGNLSVNTERQGELGSESDRPESR